MGKALSMIKNPFKNYNLESRAHKVISISKPLPAPKFEKDQVDFDRLMKEYPEVYQESLKKDPQLDRNLKDVYVTSYDPNVDIKKSSNPERPLPTDRKTVPSFLYGIKETNKIPVGKVKLGTALEFITMHQSQPRTYDAKKIASEYSLPENIVKDVLKYFRVFEIYIPQDRKTKASFAGPSVPKIKTIKELRKQLPPLNQGNEKT